MGRIDLICLGTGKGDTAVYSGHPSTAYAILLDSFPVLLLDLGLGVTRSALHLCHGVLPEVFYISHNHLDSCAELPIVVSVESAKAGKKLRVIAAPEVLRRLLNHRFAEYHDAMAMRSKQLSDLAEFVECPEGEMTPLVGDFSLVAVPSQHSEKCYGCILFYKDRPILSYGADSGFDHTFYTKLLTSSPSVILDCRDGPGTYDHASYEEVHTFLRSMPPTNATVYLSHYGADVAREGPPANLFGQMRNVATLVTGDVICLLQSDIVQSPYAQWRGLLPSRTHHQPSMASPPRSRRDLVLSPAYATNISSATEPPRHQDPIRPENVLRQYTYRLPGQRAAVEHHTLTTSQAYQWAVPNAAKKIYVFSNEDKSASPCMVPLYNIRTMQQLKLKVSELIPTIKPLRTFHTLSGRTIQHVEELEHMQEVVVVKHAGSPFDLMDLPRGLRISHLS